MDSKHDYDYKIKVIMVGGMLEEGKEGMEIWRNLRMQIKIFIWRWYCYENFDDLDRKLLRSKNV